MNEVSAREPVRDVDALLGLEPTPGQRLGRWRYPIVAAGLAIAAVAALLWLFSEKSPNAVRYVTEPAAHGDLDVIVTATGSVQPTNQVDVSSELSGTVRKVFVDYNSPVALGQPLAELDTDKLVASVASSRAKLEAAKARVAQADATVRETHVEFERKQALAGRQISSARDLDVAKAAHDRAVASAASARADVGVAEADLRLDETNLAKGCICSPINGIVLQRNIDPGQTVASSFQAPVLFTIAEDLKQMEIQVDVDEADVGQVKESQKALFTVDAYPDRKFPATIRELRFASEIVQGVVTYKAVLVVDNSELLLRPGMTATAEIAVQHVSGALLVPNAALRFSPPSEASAGQNSGFLKRLMPGMPQFRPPSVRDETGSSRRVWVLREGAPAAVPVVVGATDGKRTEIREGELKPGQPVIVDATAAR